MSAENPVRGGRESVGGIMEGWVCGDEVVGGKGWVGLFVCWEGEMVVCEEKIGKGWDDLCVWCVNVY